MIRTSQQVTPHRAAAPAAAAVVYLLVDNVVAVPFAVPYARRQAVLLRSPLHRPELLPGLGEMPLLVLVVVRPRDDIVVVGAAVFFLGRLSQEARLLDHALLVFLQEPGVGAEIGRRGQCWVCLVHTIGTRISSTHRMASRTIVALKVRDAWSKRMCGGLALFTRNPFGGTVCPPRPVRLQYRFLPPASICSSATVLYGGILYAVH